MREKIARTIFKKLHGYEPADNLFSGPYAGKSPIGKSMALADAALDALMEPTEEMLNAGSMRSGDQFTAMIRAAKEGK